MVLAGQRRLSKYQLPMRPRPDSGQPSIYRRVKRASHRSPSIQPHSLFSQPGKVCIFPAFFQVAIFMQACGATSNFCESGASCLPSCPSQQHQREPERDADHDDDAARQLVHKMQPIVCIQSQFTSHRAIAPQSFTLAATPSLASKLSTSQFFTFSLLQYEV